MLSQPCSWMHGLSACASCWAEVTSGSVLQKSTRPASSAPYFFSRYGRAIGGISSPQYDSLGTLMATRLAAPRSNSAMAAAVRAFSAAMDPCRTTTASTCCGTESAATSRNPPQWREASYQHRENADQPQLPVRLLAWFLVLRDVDKRVSQCAPPGQRSNGRRAMKTPNSPAACMAVTGKSEINGLPPTIPYDGFGHTSTNRKR